jgi:hypothetical protein
MSDMNPTPDFEGKVRKAVDVPDAAPEFVNKLRTELARRPVKMKPRFVLKPAWAVVFAMIIFALIAATPSAVNALKKLFGYVPGVGLVENTAGLRMLAEPVSVMREGVTLTITNVFVYADRVELMYEVLGIEPVNDGTLAEDAPANQTAFCGGVHIGEGPNKDGDALLRLPDGTLLERDATGKYPQNVFAMKPVYAAIIPADVNEMTLVLKCIPWARLGAVPENWEVPFKLVTVPVGTIVGEPVIEVTQPVEEEPASSSTVPASNPEVKMTLERIVPTDSAMVFYLNFDMVNHDPSLISIMPVSAHVVDSLGQQIPLRGSFVWQPFEHQVGSSFEFVSESKPADGPLTVVVDQTRAYYMPLYTDPPQATAEQLSFTFDAGEAPQHGQKWMLNKIFAIAGYEFEVATAQAVTFSDIETPSYIDGSQGYDYGYQFAIESDPSLGLSVEMDISADTCWLYDVKKIEPSPLLYTQLCRDGYPKGPVTVTIRELSITSDEDLQVEWTP